MMMMSLYNMKEIPFKDICFHGLVRDEKGQKMSKSKNNGIDPLEMIRKYGADALRMSLLVQAGSGRDVLIGDARVEAYRNFTTKIWNAARFAEMNGATVDKNFDPKHVKLPLNAWVITKLSEAEKTISKAIDTYSINEASISIYHFIWGTFCDWYLEMSKPIFYGDNEQAKAETRSTMAYVFEKMITLLHPFMPFITEELWAETGDRTGMLMAQTWPDLTTYENKEAAAKIDWAIGFISQVRSLRAEMGISAGAKIALRLMDANEQQKELIMSMTSMIHFMAKTDSIEFVDEHVKGSVSTVFDGIIVMIPLEGLIDVAKEKERLTKEMDNLKGFIERSEAQLSNESFVSKAPEKVINERKKALADAQENFAKLTEAYKRLAEI